MKKIISLFCFLFFLMNCQTEQLDADRELVVNPEKGAAFNDRAFPQQIFLPTGFAPEGIVKGKGSEFFVGSFFGAVYKGDFRTGEGIVLVPPMEGRVSIGMDYDARTGNLFVAGLYGVAYVYDGTTGVAKATINLNALPFPFTFVNDCIVSNDAVYFTDSFRDVFYRVPLLKSGHLPEPIEVMEIQLTGDYQFLPWIPPGDPSTLTINGNGIVTTPNGQNLIIGNTQTGLLYLVDPMTGNADEIDLGGVALFNDDGLVLRGKKLFVVQNFFNQISVVELNADYLSGEVVEVITDPEYKIPATATLFGDRLYAVNARFDVAPPPLLGGDPTGVEFDVIGVSVN